MKDDSQHRNHWPMACIVEIFADKHGYVWNDKLKLVSQSLLEWPISKIVSVDRVWIKTIECGFTPKCICDMTRTYSQMHHTDKYSEHSLIIRPVWPNGWVFV